MAEPNDKETSTSENFTEGQLLARRKQRKKRRQERLIQGQFTILQYIVKDVVYIQLDFENGFR